MNELQNIKTSETTILKYMGHYDPTLTYNTGDTVLMENNEIYFFNGETWDSLECQPISFTYDIWEQIRDDLAHVKKEGYAEVSDVIADIDSLIWRRMNGLEAEDGEYKTISFG